MDRKLQFLESFNASGSDGQIYKVCGYEHLVRDESVSDGLERWEPTGEVEYRLADGARVENSGVELKQWVEEKTSA